MPLPITAFYAGLLGLWLMFLAFKVGQRRSRHKVALGTGGVPELESAVRAHGNAAETIPIALILLGLADGLGTPGWILHLLGVALVAGRLMHGYHFIEMRPDLTFRFWGMMLTVLPILLLATGLVGHAFLRLAGVA